MQTFKLDKNTKIVCERIETRRAFKHTATLLFDEWRKDDTKICYCNRTWKSFEFESVLNKLLDRNPELLSKTRRKNFMIKASGMELNRAKKELGTIATIAMLGDVFGTDQKQKNDWKTRMLKAGLENKGLIMPDDWNELNENEKEKRLNKVIEAMSA